MNHVPVKSLKLPLQILEYAHEKILNELSRGSDSCLQDKGPIYEDLLEMAIAEIRRLCDEAMGG